MGKGKGIKYEGQPRFGGSMFRLSFSYLPYFALSLHTLDNTGALCYWIGVKFKYNEYLRGEIA